MKRVTEEEVRAEMEKILRQQLTRQPVEMGKRSSLVLEGSHLHEENKEPRRVTQN